MANPSIFESRVLILSYIAKSKKPVSNIDLQLEFGLSKESLNRILKQFRDWGYIKFVRCGNAYLYEITNFSKRIFNEND